MLPDTSLRPIAFQTAHAVKTIFTTASGRVELADVLAHIQAKTLTGVLSYGELFDGRNISLELSVPDLFLIAREIRKVMHGKKPCRIAVVVSSAFLHGLVRQYGKIAIVDGQEVAAFRNYEEAHAWILRNVQVPRVDLRSLRAVAGFPAISIHS
jgi:hypothetical protein